MNEPQIDPFHLNAPFLTTRTDTIRPEGIKKYVHGIQNEFGIKKILQKRANYLFLKQYSLLKNFI